MPSSLLPMVAPPDEVSLTMKYSQEGTEKFQMMESHISGPVRGEIPIDH